MKNLILAGMMPVMILFVTDSWSQAPLLNSYSQARATIFLDFDGHTVQGTSWNWSSGSIACSPSGLSSTRINEVFNRVAEDFRPFNINVTTDSARFLAAPLNQRMRAIITTSSSWYGSNAGGVAFVSSFTWGDDHPCFVFSALLNYSVKKISEAVSHEVGHTLGLYHQSLYDNSCKKLTDYNPGQGTGEIGWAPIMGSGYSRNFTLWSIGPGPFDCNSIQSDLDIITSAENGFGFRSDDHADTFDNATPAILSNNQFQMNGVISRNTDQDLIRFSMPSRAQFKLAGNPYSVGEYNSGSNLDLQISLYDGSRNLLNIYNPATLLNSVADTILNPGIYFMKVEGKGNVNAPAYASLGSYSLNVSIVGGAPLTVPEIRLNGKSVKGFDLFNWSILAEEKMVSQTMEISRNGNGFIPLAELGKKDSSFSYQAKPGENSQYRLHVLFESGRQYNSNIIALSNHDDTDKPKLIGNLISAGIFQAMSPGGYNYAILDLNGRVLQSGQLVNGINKISLAAISPGIYLIRFTGNNTNYTEKLLLQ